MQAMNINNEQMRIKFFFATNPKSKAMIQKLQYLDFKTSQKYDS
jgi:hypothetical protein